MINFDKIQTIVFDCDGVILDSNDIKKELTQEFYKRVYLPFYILLITIIVSFIILKSHFEMNYKFKKIQIFLIGI